MNVMAVDPVARVVAPRFWAGVFSMPLLASIFNVAGILRRVFSRRRMAGFGRRYFLVANAKQHHLPLRRTQRLNQIRRFRRSRYVNRPYIRASTAYRLPRILRASTRTVVSSALTILAVDFMLTAWMFTD